MFIISGLLSCYLIREIDRENKRKEKQGIDIYMYIYEYLVLAYAKLGEANKPAKGHNLCGGGGVQLKCE